MELVSTLESLSITESRPDCLPFKTALSSTLSDSGSDHAYQVIPRYLFRVISPNSHGINNNIWMKSHDAASPKGDIKVDIFAMEQCRAAAMLYRHLQWGDVGDEDNLISWTSSQLYAVQYIMRLHNYYGIDFNHIKLCVIDSTRFSSGTFLRDLELIRAFRPFDSYLARFGQLRRRQHSHHNGHYYFGEYLCQGSLRVEGRCQIVDASALVDNGLFILLPRLQEHSTEWANRVIALREEYATDAPVAITEEGLQAVTNIAGLYQPRWRLPIATYLLALRPRDPDNEDILHALNPQILKFEETNLVQDFEQVIEGVSDKDRRDFVFKTEVDTHEHLPEVAQVQGILLALKADYSNTELLNSMQSACRIVRVAYNRSMKLPESAFQPYQNILQETRYQRVRSYIGRLRCELSRLEQALPGSGVPGIAMSPEETDLEDYVSDAPEEPVS